SRRTSWTWSWPCAKPRGAATPCATRQSSPASTRVSKRPSTPSGDNEVSRPPDLTAALLSAFLPGAGQLLKRHYAKAAEVLTLGLMLGTAWYLGYAFEGPFTPFLLYGFVPIVGAAFWVRQFQDD